MKASCVIQLLLLSFLAAATKVTQACDCFPTSLEDSLYNDDVQTVFRGHVQRMVTFNDTTPFPPNYYVVNVLRVYKGCLFQNATTVLIETAAESAMCGVVNFDLKKSYLFSGYMIPAKQYVTEKIAPKNPTILRTAMVYVHLCQYNSEFKSLAPSEKALLGNTTNICTKCDSAGDCPGGMDGGKYYCDQGKCVAYDRPCPPVPYLPWLKDLNTCVDDSCSTPTPCGDAKCVVNKCDKCGWPLWIDSKGNRVCRN
jgi:hypothetical protein